MGKFRKKVIILIYGIAITSLSLIPFIDIKRPFSKQNTIAMYIEDNNGNYQLSSSKEFPKEGYILNLEKSSCKNGGILSQDVNTKEINLIISKNDACNLYFEKEKLPLLETIMNKRNDDTVTVYTEGMISEMYTFDHEEATQTTG